jgi:phenol 2-monooxygenase
VRYSDLHKTYIDDEHYNAGHGHAYEKYGVDPKVGAVVLVRPDQCKFFQTIQRGKC